MTEDKDKSRTCVENGAVEFMGERLGTRRRGRLRYVRARRLTSPRTVGQSSPAAVKWPYAFQVFFLFVRHLTAALISRHVTQDQQERIWNFGQFTRPRRIIPRCIDHSSGGTLPS